METRPQSIAAFGAGTERRPIAPVVRQHVEEAAHLRHVRSVLVRGPHVRLLHLARLDERIAAHIDGIAVAGAYGAELCNAALAPADTGSMFAALVGSIEGGQAARVDRLLAIAEAVPKLRSGAVSAFGWASASTLRGLSKRLLDSADPWRQEVGLAACAMHRVDPGVPLLLRTAQDLAKPAALRARALGVAAALGHIDVRQACVDAASRDDSLGLAAACAGALVGDRSSVLEALRRFGSRPGRERERALGLLLKLASTEDSYALLRAMHDEPGAIRSLIRATGAAGDARFVPWLIAQMGDLAFARLAGESFSVITGLDLAYLDLDRKPPEGAGAEPSADPSDENVALDEDDSLPWPDPQKIAAWWKANGARLPAGNRYFMGEPPTAAHCLAVLQTGFQRQRRHAAEYLCLLKPGTPLFNIAAPAWRQQRLLAQMPGP